MIDSLYEKLYNETKLKIKNNSYNIAVITTTYNEDCKNFIKSINKIFTSFNIKVGIHDCINYNEEEILNLIDELNNNIKVNGILVLLPINKNLNKKTILNRININKDIDCLSNNALSKILNKNNNCIYPSVVKSILYIIENINKKDKNVLIINRSNLIGIPLSILLLSKDYTVNICHSKSSNIDKYINLANIIINASDNTNNINFKNINKNATIINTSSILIPNAINNIGKLTTLMLINNIINLNKK